MRRAILLVIFSNNKNQQLFSNESGKYIKNKSKGGV